MCLQAKKLKPREYCALKKLLRKKSIQTGECPGPEDYVLDGDPYCYNGSVYKDSEIFKRCYLDRELAGILNDIEGFSTCRDGQCIAITGEDCNPNIDTTKPSEVSGKYLYCDSSTNKWEALGEGQKITFTDSCPNSYRIAYLEAISIINQYLFPDRGITIDCQGYISGGGWSGTNDPDVPIVLYCDPVAYPISCFSTLTHEFAHTWEVRQDGTFDNEEFNEVIGCRLEDPQQSIYAYDYEIAVDDDKYGPFLEFKDGVGYSNLNCTEAFALANNHYVYNGCYQKENYPIQYEWLKNNIYDGKELLEYCQ